MAYASWSVVFGEQPSAAKWNILGTNDSSFNDGTGIAGFYKNLLTVDSNPYKFNAYLTSAQNVGTADTLVQYNAENYDTNNNFDSTTNKGRYTAPVAGFYQFNANLLTTTAGSGTSIVMSFRKNGSAVTGGLRQDVGASLAPGLALSTCIQLAASDYVEVFCGSGAAAKALDVSSNFTNTFSGFLVCRT